ncbi:MAG TPA: hypothetical protein PLR60_12300 [Syntrophorhabdaceae bacterium]|nr:hypothetical protein [Syntrophorhabdaceae bacterium]
MNKAIKKDMKKGFLKDLLETTAFSFTVKDSATSLVFKASG